MSSITTHILDTSLGKPATGVTVCLAIKMGDAWKPLGQGVTNNDGRITDLLSAGNATPGIYKLTFQTKAYFEAANRETFYPYVDIVFEIQSHQSNEHFHVPLLLNGFGHSTYRGS